MNISLDYSLTCEEWCEAFDANNRSVVRNRRPIVLLTIIASVLAAVLLASAMQYSGRLLFTLIIIAAPVFFIAAFGWSGLQRKLHDLANEEWESNPTLRSRCTITFDDAALMLVQEHRQATWQWPAFVKFDETKGLLLLYVSERSFLAVPKRAFSAADLVVFSKFLAKTLPPARPNVGGFEVISKPLPPTPVHVQPLESREFM
ncbi:MAG TPA: YcxB family protein [Tepidisphaeraceae bacterium]|jgi:hypothetical protein|nr:YcxB family protein [Tepidisphaeraceae bacterium]